ncbi:hypothetical protein [Allopontixanthobacter sediminis]|uniref:DUF1570 domain-containing protein n=1 Tax=Allopontixanthobacter sediminis TaxID=1689985 RepID=A0A845AZM1_9SPHN|nr:hypothetical protein [Allopontixanthobacter sediminis]MXP42882.1 hypothetical protein [Allopontixanthobacter sediminis]
MFRILLAVISGLVLTAPAQAEWREASSDHFVIYSDQSEKRLRDFAEMLEGYHSAMEYITSIETGPISPSNRVTIYVLDSDREVRKLYGDTSSNVTGFYSSRAGGSLAFVPRLANGSRTELSDSELILLHEYAHHFMYSNYGIAFPMWLSEGFAEFYASARFERDGSIWIGRPAMHRAYELLGMREIPIELLLDTEAYAKREKTRQGDSFYGRSWLLYHYLTMAKFDAESSRADQLSDYQRNLFKGQGALEAARNAFGDLEQLDKDIDKYLRQRQISSFKLPAASISVGPIAIRTLAAGAEEAMATRIQSRRGVDAEKAAEILPGIRLVGAKFPDDPFVQATLAEAEFDAGNDALAIAAADRSLAGDLSNISAHIQKIYATFRAAEDAGTTDQNAGWSALRNAIVAANKVENDHPIPLIYFFRSFGAQGRPASDLAVQGLEQALSLAPYDVDLRLNVARQQIRDERFSSARQTLARLLLDPHKTGIAEVASELMDRIEGEKDRSKTAETPEDANAD